MAGMHVRVHGPLGELPRVQLSGVRDALRYVDTVGLPCSDCEPALHVADQTVSFSRTTGQVPIVWRGSMVAAMAIRLSSIFVMNRATATAALECSTSITPQCSPTQSRLTALRASSGTRGNRTDRSVRTKAGITSHIRATPILRRRASRSPTRTVS